IQATFEDPAPAQTTVLTVLSRLEGKGLVTRHAPPPRRVTFEATMSSAQAHASNMVERLDGAEDREGALLAFADNLSEEDLDLVMDAITTPPSDQPRKTASPTASQWPSRNDDAAMRGVATAAARRPYISTARPIACAVGDEASATVGVPSPAVRSGSSAPPSSRAVRVPEGSATSTGVPTDAAASWSPARPSACCSGPPSRRAKAYSVCPLRV